MNSNTTSRLATRAAAAAACLGAVLAGATACGTDDANTTASPRLGHQAAQGVGGAAPASAELSEKAKANIWEYMWQVEPQQSGGAHSYGDDRRQQQGQTGSHRQHPSGYDKALLNER